MTKRQVSDWTSGRATSDEPHHTVTLDITALNLSGDLYGIFANVFFHCGDEDVTYNWSLRNQTDNIEIDSGTFTPSNPGTLCSNRPLSFCLREFVEGEQPGYRRRILVRQYKLSQDWRGKTIRFRLWDPSETNTMKLTIQAAVGVSVWQEV